MSETEILGKCIEGILNGCGIGNFDSITRDCIEQIADRFPTHKIFIRQKCISYTLAHTKWLKDELEDLFLRENFLTGE